MGNSKVGVMGNSLILLSRVEVMTKSSFHSPLRKDESSTFPEYLQRKSCSCN